jgi:DMSO/TMAO reductase YedYZ molybdopterin-dependent catalytic subunit
LRVVAALTRRQLLGGSLGFGLGGPTLASIGCGSTSPPSNASGSSDGDAGAACADPFAGGTMLGTVPFTGELGPGTQLEVANGIGLNGRLYTDLSKLAPDALVTPTEHYYIRTRVPDRLDPTPPWKIAVGGLVKAPLDLTLDGLAAHVKTGLGPFVMECSGNGAFAAFGMLSAASWSGVPLSDLLALVAVEPSATRVLISGFDEYSAPAPANSTPGASWIFTFAELDAAGAFLATEMNGAPLPSDHGFPVRLMVPNWYGCCCVKWVNQITLVDDTAPATSQMQEYAGRTHQTGIPTLARDYRAATIDQAAMPVRIEKWRVGGAIAYRVVGIMWGGYQVTDKLAIRFGPNEAYVPVDVCPKQSTNETWTLWSHRWLPTSAGSYAIDLHVDDPASPTKRLDAGFYRRTLAITEV